MSYWSDRQKELYSALEKDENELKQRLASVYQDEYNKLDREIAAYYQKYGENNVIKYRKLMQTLPEEDARMLIEQMDDFVAKYPQYAHLVPVRTSIYKLDRLEGLQYSVRIHQLNIGAVNQQAIAEHLNKQALRGANAAMETMGFGKNFYTVNSDIVKKFVDVPWCNGLSFSQRIWQDGDKLANYITTDIAQGFARGTSYEKLTKQLCTRFEGVSKKDAYRLIYTEGTYVMAESTIQPFTEDFEDYRVSTAADGKVCSICSSIAKETFKIKDRKPGINFPPFHPWCRCTFEIVEPADWDKWMDDYVKRHNNSQVNNIISALKANNNSDIINVDRENISEAKKYLTDVLGLECEGYEKLPLKVANLLNQELTSAFDKFGNLKDLGSLKKIRITRERSQSYAAYNFSTKEIWLNPDNLKLSEMLETAVFNKKYGYWSTGETVHSIRHEIGHSVGYGYVHKNKNSFIDRNKADELAMLLMDTENKCGIKNWNSATSGEKRAAGDILSYYGLYSEQEFIAEAVAEYMAGNPRETALKIVEIIMRGIK